MVRWAPPWPYLAACVQTVSEHGGAQDADGFMVFREITTSELAKVAAIRGGPGLPVRPLGAAPQECARPRDTQQPVATQVGSMVVVALRGSEMTVKKMTYAQRSAWSHCPVFGLWCPALGGAATCSSLCPPVKGTRRKCHL